MKMIVINTVRNCARCGRDHNDPMEAKPLTLPFAPPEAGGLVWTHWFACPTNGEPVMVKIDDEPGPSFVVEGQPMTGRCASCGVDLDALRERGVISHVCAPAWRDIDGGS